MRPANLARRPFRNERLPNLIFAVATVAVLALTARHALVVRALLPRRTSALHDEVLQLEKASASLRAEQASLRNLNPEPKALARWLVVKDLVDRRAFSWTGLFARLEERLPDGARLVSIAPAVHQGEIALDVQAMVRSPEVGWQFMRALEEGGSFDTVFPLSEGENGEFHYTMRYRPATVTAEGPPPAGSAAPATEAAPSDEAEVPLATQGAPAATEGVPSEGAPATAGVAPLRRPPAGGAAPPAADAVPPAGGAVPPVGGAAAPPVAAPSHAITPPVLPMTPSGVRPRRSVPSGVSS